jgi:predicted membrane protein
MNLFPFTKNTLKSASVILVVFMLFYFWDFSFHPILNIALKSALITIIYVWINYKLMISEEVNEFIDKFLFKTKF